MPRVGVSLGAYICLPEGQPWRHRGQRTPEAQALTRGESYSSPVSTPELRAFPPPRLRPGIQRSTLPCSSATREGKVLESQQSAVFQTQPCCAGGQRLTPPGISVLGCEPSLTGKPHRLIPGTLHWLLRPSGQPVQPSSVCGAVLMPYPTLFCREQKPHHQAFGGAWERISQS